MSNFPEGFIPVPASLFRTPPSESEKPYALEVPARVRVAVELLRLISNKTEAKIAVNDVGMERWEGQKLTESEQGLHDSLCMVLDKYVSGLLPLDDREKANNNLMGNGKQGMLIRCFHCAHYFPNGPPRSDCQFCKGNGELLIFPV